MKNIILTTILLFMTFIVQAQSNIIYDKVIHMTVACSKGMDLEIPPNNPDFIITNAEYVNGIVNKLTYWDELYDSTFTKTLVIYESNIIDSVFVIENSQVNYRYKRENGKWLIQNFEITSPNLTLNHIAVGLTSKEVFKILNKKIKAKVGNGKIWILNEAKTRLILTFFHDKLVSMKL
ncbi:MAG TPA: hypothetical protein PKZ75_05435 [Bacteroidia bacterium]|nr:hypothetical protein [Bacteroidia bacterium]